MRTVLTYSAFDVLHTGHINLLRRARGLGDRLIVGLSTDEFNAGKHKTSLLNYDNRKAVLEAMRYVDLVIPEQTWKQKVDDIRKHAVDVFVMGHDWEVEFDFPREYCEVAFRPRADGISSTMVSMPLSDLDAD